MSVLWTVFSILATSWSVKGLGKSRYSVCSCAGKECIDSSWRIGPRGGGVRVVLNVAEPDKGLVAACETVGKVDVFSFWECNQSNALDKTIATTDANPKNFISPDVALMLAVLSLGGLLRPDMASVNICGH